MSLRRMMRNARRAVNYNLAGQLREAIDKSGPADIYLDGVERPKLSDARPESFDIDMVLRSAKEVIDGNEA